ncbi:hypothetical protein FDECE_3113 [Fusarium decemcellulare]|nr:hypothetical protein FDECE_3113 [Fusarium decemcellulare]
MAALLSAAVLFYYTRVLQPRRGQGPEPAEDDIISTTYRTVEEDLVESDDVQDDAMEDDSIDGEPSEDSIWRLGRDYDRTYLFSLYLTRKVKGLVKNAAIAFFNGELASGQKQTLDDLHSLQGGVDGVSLHRPLRGTQRQHCWTHHRDGTQAHA